jgi:cysteine desulfurase
VGSITAHFQTETTLHALAQEALLAAMEAGWADPKKIGQAASRAALLRNSALESISDRLSLTPDQLEISGEVGLGYFLALAGFLSEEKKLFFGAGDRSGVMATVRSHRGESEELSLDRFGKLNIPESSLSANSVFSFQLVNGETGAINHLPESVPDDLLIAVDASAAGARVKLPNSWGSAIFDSRAWCGPAGLAIIAINRTAQWKNPLPHISSVRRTYGTYSLPLLLASAVALENFTPDDTQLRKWNEQIRIGITKELPETLIAGDLNQSLPHLISFIFKGANGEEILRTLAQRNIAVDSGSACTAMNLQPSHVLAAMGLPTDGNIRITLHEETTQTQVDELITALVDAVQSQLQR